MFPDAWRILPQREKARTSTRSSSEPHVCRACTHHPSPHTKNNFFFKKENDKVNFEFTDYLSKNVYFG